MIFVPDKKVFTNDKAVECIIKNNRWVEHGSCLSSFLDDIQYEDNFPTVLKGLKLHDVLAKEEFKQYLKNWLSLRYDYVLNSLKEVNIQKELPIVIERQMYLTEKEIEDVIDNKKTKVGIFWAHESEPNAYSSSNEDQKQKVLVTLTACANNEDINWHQTILSRMDYDSGDDEGEIQVFEDAQLLMTSLYDYDKKLLRSISGKFNKLLVHGSDMKHKNGEMLLSRGDAYEKEWEKTPFYRALKHHAPIGAREHKDSVFMTDNVNDLDNAGALSGYTYIVKPEGEVSRHDMAWSTKISELIDDGIGLRNEKIRVLSEKYWSGIPSESPVWEYTANSFVIVKGYDSESDMYTERDLHNLLLSLENNISTSVFEQCV